MSNNIHPLSHRIPNPLSEEKDEHRPTEKIKRTSREVLQQRRRCVATGRNFPQVSSQNVRQCSTDSHDVFTQGDRKSSILAAAHAPSNPERHASEKTQTFSHRRTYSLSEEHRIAGPLLSARPISPPFSLEEVINIHKGKLQPVDTLLIFLLQMTNDATQSKDLLTECLKDDAVKQLKTLRDHSPEDETPLSRFIMNLRQEMNALGEDAFSTLFETFYSAVINYRAYNETQPGVDRSEAWIGCGDLVYGFKPWIEKLRIHKDIYEDLDHLPPFTSHKEAKRQLNERYFPNQKNPTLAKKNLQMLVVQSSFTLSSSRKIFSLR